MATQVPYPPPTRRLTVDEVLQMAEAGIIRETERIELIDGGLVEMSPEGPDHAAVAARLTTRLARTYPDRYTVRSQSTLPIGEHEYVEPDVMVLNADLEGWPSVENVVLVIEVARSSAAWDKGGKASIYAEWGVSVYWVVDLNRKEVLVHTSRGREGYRKVAVYREGDEVPLPAIDASLPVREILSPG